jgi:hypothetical protein
MKRIFATLATLNGLALAATFLVGLLSWSRGALRNPSDSTFAVHFFLGLFTAIGTLLVHCLIFTYFLGTGRWVKEVAIAYGLPDQPIPKLTRELKRQTFPPALAAMLITIATAAAGAGAQLRLPGWPWQLHLALGIVTLGVNLWAFRIEHRNVRANAAALEEVVRAVDQIRAERGLPTNAEALRQEGGA